jgi:redox-sensitive bicupin YhaK (pirin superfamily)
MTRLPDNEPSVVEDGSGHVALVIESHPRDLGGFTVRRALPSPAVRLLGPFIFFDHMGPVRFPAGEGISVRPHPHIALATITYLFEGEIIHRDSLGNEQPIRPGDVNWMVAGRGIVHSERSSAERRAAGGALHGLQTWVALPLEHEETEPRFEHHVAATIPVWRQAGLACHVIAGSAYGLRAPTGILSPTLYVHARLDAGATLPVDDEHAERAVYVVRGAVDCEGRSFGEGSMVVLRAGPASVHATAAADIMLVGGAPIEGVRHIWWNFVASSRERIERAKADWREGRFPKVPGDDKEFIPLPEG